PPPTHTYALSLHDALPIYAREFAQQAPGELLAGGALEQRRRGPVVGPGLRAAQRLRFIDIARDDVRVQRRLLVAEDRIVDARGSDRKSTRLNSSHRTISYA